MIVTTGRLIKIEAGYKQQWRFERTCETPGRVIVIDKNFESFNLPGNLNEAEAFIAAYRRILAEDIEYKKCENE